jgi:hypothetical protein
MSENEVSLFFNLMAHGFLTFFDTIETERAKLFLSFSHIPHSKQDDMGKVRHQVQLYSCLSNENQSGIRL